MAESFRASFNEDFRERRRFLEKELPRLHKKNEKEGRIEAAGKREDYGVYDSALDSYETTFYQVLPKGEKLKDYIETFLAERRGSAVGLELGGTGSRLFESFDSNFFEASAGVALGDPRTNKRKELDVRNGHLVISGDMTAPKTKDEVEEWLGTRKIDLLIKRVVGGSAHIPFDPGLMIHETRYWYSKMNERSLMFLETHAVPSLAIKRWSKFINDNPANNIEAVYPGMQSLKIARFKGSPKKLPYLK
jgi:hypothetical protein